MMPYWLQNIAKAPNYMWICFWRGTSFRTTHNGILKNCTVANMEPLQAFLRV